MRYGYVTYCRRVSFHVTQSAIAEVTSCISLPLGKTLNWLLFARAWRTHSITKDQLADALEMLTESIRAEGMRDAY